jgi:hypothetical protein
VSLETGDTTQCRRTRQNLHPCNEVDRLHQARAKTVGVSLGNRLYMRERRKRSERADGPLASADVGADCCGRGLKGRRAAASPGSGRCARAAGHRPRTKPLKTIRPIKKKPGFPSPRPLLSVIVPPAAAADPGELPCVSPATPNALLSPRRPAFFSGAPADARAWA